MKIRRTIAYYASYITVGFVIGIIGPTLPSLANQTGTLLSRISLLFPILSVGSLLGSFLSGHLFDRVKGHHVMIISVALLITSMTFIPLTPLFWTMMFFFFIVGLASSGLDVGGNTLLIWVHKDKVGPFMVGLHFFFGLGAFTAPMVVGQALKATGEFEWSYWTLAIICVPVIICFLLINSPVHDKVLTDDEKVKTDKLLVFLISLFMFLHVGAELSFGGWIYSYAIKRELTSVTQAAYLTSAYWGAITGGRLISVFISMKLKSRTMLVVYLYGCILAVILLLLGRNSVMLTWIGTILLGISISTLIPSTFTFAKENMDITGKVTSWLVIGLGAGNMFFPWFIGQLFEPVGEIMLPVINLITFLAALLLILIIFRYSRRKA
jgi:MFS transporter, FHS family, Na+ dependent glucose transporter 1